MTTANILKISQLHVNQMNRMMNIIKDTKEAEKEAGENNAEAEENTESGACQVAPQGAL